MGSYGRARFAAIVVGVVAIGNACNPNGCGPTNSGPDFEVDVGGNEIWSYAYPLAQFTDYSWEGADFAAPPTHPFPVLPDPGANVSFKFRDIGETFESDFQPSAGTPPIVLRTQPELHLFARDPKELFRTLTKQSIPNSSGFLDWIATLRSPSIAGIDTTPFELPADVVVPYGDATSLTSIYPAQVSSIVGWQDFWRFEADGSPTIQITGPAAPVGTAGALRAARVLTLPECSKSIPFTKIYQTLSDKLTSALTCRHLGIADLYPSIEDLVAMPYLDHNGLPEQGLTGGLLVQGDFGARGEIRLPAADNSPCSTHFKYNFELKLDGQGLLALVPHKLELSSSPGSLCNGYGIVSGIQGDLQDALERQLPTLIHQIAEEEQAIPPAWNKTFNSQGRPNAFSCHYPSHIEIDGQQFETNAFDDCAKARSALKFELHQGVIALHREQTGDETSLDNVIDSAENWICRPPTNEEFNSNESAYDSCASDIDCAPSTCSNGHCADLAACTNPPSTFGVQGRCEFILPARDLIIEPDEIRVGFAPILSNGSPEPTPSNAAFYIAAALGQIPQLCSPAHPSCVPKINGSCPTGFEESSLCSDTNADCVESVTPTHPFYHRYFSTLDLSGRECTEPSDPPLICGCTNSGMCAVGDQCAEDTKTRLNECAHACDVNSDCTDRLFFAGSVNTNCSSDADCMGTACVNGACQINTGVKIGAGVGCYPDIHLCASGAHCGNCFPWEHCNTTNLPTPFPGGCVENEY